MLSNDIFGHVRMKVLDSGTYRAVPLTITGMDESSTGQARTLASAAQSWSGGSTKDA